jgi:hypothetical protein
MWRSLCSDARELGDICMRAPKSLPKVIGSGSKETVSDETTRMVDVPSRRIRAPCKMLWWFGLCMLETWFPRSLSRLFHRLSDLGRGRFSIVCSNHDRVSRRCCVIIRLPGPKGEGRLQQCPILATGGLSSLWPESLTSSAYHIPRRPLTIAQDD